jgi:acyl-CoA thioesterase
MSEPVRRDPGIGGLGGLLGAERAEMGEGRCTFALRLAPEHMNPYGTVHGGVVYSLVDFAMGGAMVSRLEPGERCATLEVKINYLAPAAEGELRADAWLVERTSRVGVLQARVTLGGGRLLALATGTFYIQAGGGAAPAP